jgi:hypothetical protein
MNVRLQRDFEFSAGVYWDDQFLMNEYRVKVDFTTLTEIPQEQTTAFERMRTFIEGVLQDTVFLHYEDHERARTLAELNIKSAILPAEPFDQIIGIMLFCKLNAIVEGKVEITDVQVCSKAGNWVWFLHAQEESTGPFANENWWHDASIMTVMKPKPIKGDKIVSLEKTPAWAEFGLEFNSAKGDNKVVAIVNKTKDENGPT